MKLIEEYPPPLLTAKIELYTVGHGVELGLNDTHGQIISCRFNLWRTSSTVLAGEKWRINLSVIHNHIYSISYWSEDHEGKAENEYPVYRIKFGHDVKHVVLRYFVITCHLAGLEDRANHRTYDVKNILMFVQITVDSI